MQEGSSLRSWPGEITTLCICITESVYTTHPLSCPFVLYPDFVLISFMYPVTVFFVCSFMLGEHTS